MKITLNNLGPLKQAEFEIGGITIICGPNNTGKTYATYATYGFFDFIRSTFFPFPVDDNIIKQLLIEGSILINLKSYADNLQKQINKAAKQYSKILSKVFAGNEKLFADTAYSIEINNKSHYEALERRKIIGTAEKTVLQLKKEKGQKEIIVSLVIDTSSEDIPPPHFIKEVIGDFMREVIINSVIPRPFIASAERTGSAIFQKELDFTRNRLIELLRDKTSKIHPLQLLDKFSGKYPIPVRKNVDFIRAIPNIVNEESFILKQHPNVLNAFKDIIGGEYRVTKDGEIQYVLGKNKSLKLSLVESSSAVRSLLDVGFYLRHVAQPGDLFVIDEPELNLHPENQRRIARLFARMVNLGIKVFMTTHSDYIIKELNTLIMLNHDKPHLKRIRENEGYEPEELLSSDKVKVYIAEEALVMLPGAKRRTRSLTLVPADIDPEMGIEARSFDKTIEDMNRIQEEIVWGG